MTCTACVVHCVRVYSDLHGVCVVHCVTVYCASVGNKKCSTLFDARCNHEVYGGRVHYAGCVFPIRTFDALLPSQFHSKLYLLLFLQSAA